MLLEKAWAKVHGSYMRTEGGLTANACSHLIGLPSFRIDHETTGVEIWQSLKRYDESGLMVLASSNSGTND